MVLQSMELALIGAGMGGDIKHTSKLKVLNYKKASKAQMQKNGSKKYVKRKCDSTSIMCLCPS